MKIGIYGGEAFPVYEIHEDGFSEIEVDEETLNRWRKAFEQFTQVQEEIIQELEKQDKKDRIWDGGAWSGFRME